MNPSTPNGASRREFLKNTGRIAAASALAGIVLAGSSVGRVAVTGGFW